MNKSKKSKKRLKKKSHNKLLMTLALLVAIFVLLAGYLYLTRTQAVAPDMIGQSSDTTQSTPEPAFVPYNATFQIVINGETRTFTDPRYHNKSADVYIAPEGSRQVQVTVTKPDITWGNLFATLPMSVTPDCIVTGTNQTFCTNGSRRLRFYINDVETPSALTTVIEPNSQLKVVY